MDDITASIIVQCQTSGASQAVNKLGFAFAMLTKNALNFGSEAVKEFSDLQEETQKFGVVFGDMGKKASAVVDQLVSEFGQSELSAKKMMSSAGDLLTGWKMNPQYVLEMSEGLAKLGADIASFSNYSGGAERAAYALTKAMLGETEMAKMLGVAIKTDSPEFKKLEKQALSTGITVANTGKIYRAETAAQAKAIAAYATMYDQKGHVLGDFKRNMGSIANQSRVLDNRIQDTKITIGSFIDSFMQVSSIKGELAVFLTDTTKFIKENSQEWAEDIAHFINIFRGGIEILWMLGKNTFTNLTEIGGFTWETLKIAWQDAPGFFGAVWEDVKITADNVWDFIRQKFIFEFEFYGEILHAFLKNWKSVFNDIFSICGRVFDSIGVYLTDWLKSMGGMLGTFGAGFWDLITGKMKFSEFAGNLADAYTDIAKNMIQNQKEVWAGFEFGAGTKEFGKDVKNATGAYFKKQADAGMNITNNIGKNTKEYLAKNGVVMGELTSITSGLDGVLDRFIQRRNMIGKGGATGQDPTHQQITPAAQPAGHDSTMVEMLRAAFRFRETAQSAVMAGTADAARLQTRMFGTGATNPQQQTTNTVKEIKQQISALMGKLDSIRQNTQGMANIAGIKRVGR